MSKYIRVKFKVGGCYVASKGRTETVAICKEIIKGKHRKATFDIDGYTYTLEVDVDCQSETLFVETASVAEEENNGYAFQQIGWYVSSDLVA